MKYNVIIIGGGIIGFSTAMQLLQQDKHLKVAVLEKEAQPAMHQTGHNSGVIHAGVYYKPGSLKAKFCVEGCAAIKDFCKAHQLPFSVPGKLIVATDAIELERMESLAERCKQNGLTVKKLSVEETKKAQPGIRTVGSFLVTETGIVDWKAVCQCYARLFTELGGKIFYNNKVCEIHESEKTVQIKTMSDETYTADYLITCSGLYADRLVSMSGLEPTFKIIPFRGEYYKLTKKYNSYFQHLIYPVPDPSLPFLGVHFTPQISGFATVGPSAVLALAREGYSWSKVNFRDLVEMASFLPIWKMIAKHFKATCQELYGSISKKQYVKLIHKYFPDIQENDLERYPAGVRAQAMNKTGGLIDDFLFMESDRTLHTCNAPSPAATSSLPIGQHIVDKFCEKLK